MKAYESLFRQYAAQKPETIFAHFYPPRKDAIIGPPDYDAPFKEMAKSSLDGYDSWTFQQPKFRAKHTYSAVPKLRNYLNYTFVRLVTLELETPGDYFLFTADHNWTCFNTGLQNSYGADLLATFQRYKPRPGHAQGIRADWVYKGCDTPSDRQYRGIFGTRSPKIAWYSQEDSRDYVFDIARLMNSTRTRSTTCLSEPRERAGLPKSF